MEVRSLPPVYRDIEDLIRVERLPTIWCPGCGLGIIMKAFLRAVKDSGIPVDRHVVVTGIGCTGRFSGYVRLDGYHTIHGRAIPFATGLKLARPELEVTVFGGDGDIASIGGNHFIHAARRNIDINVVIVNNFNYGMTGGQSAPTTPVGTRTSTAPYGHFEPPVNIPYLAVAAGATYVARWTVLHYTQMYESFKKMFRHKGFAVVEILSPCLLFGFRNDMSIIDIYMELRRRARFVKNPRPEDAYIEWGSDKPIVIGEFIHVERPTFDQGVRELIKRASGDRG